MKKGMIFLQDDRTEEKIKQFLSEYSSAFPDNYYWYPLVSLKKSIGVTAYDADKIYRSNDIVLLEKLFRECNINQVNMLQMDIAADAPALKTQSIISLLYEKDEYGYNFPWITETFYFDASKQWLAYVSHEGTISFTGTDIVKKAVVILPDKYMLNV